MDKDKYAIAVLEIPDLDVFFSLAAEFRDEMPMPFAVDIDGTLVRWKAMISAGMGFVLGLYYDARPCGMLGAIIFPDLYSGELMSTEMFWFVAEAHRGVGKHLISEFEEISKGLGAKRMAVTRMLTDPRFEQLDGFYQRFGYKPVEVSYCKEVQ